MKNIIRIGSRGSKLALTQVAIVEQALKTAGIQVATETVVITTTGDRMQRDGVKAGELTKAVFTKELEEALLTGQIDIAVHSAKDLAVEMPESLVIGAVLSRAPVNDVLISRLSLSEVCAKANPVIATSSIRRQLQWRERYPRSTFVPIRGNVDTRIRKLAENPDWDGLILAQAGMERLRPDTGDFLVSILDTAFIKPAPCQGAIVVQCAKKQLELRHLLELITHRPSMTRVRAERAFLARIEGGCNAPLGALARIYDGVSLHLSAVYYTDDAHRGIRKKLSGSSLFPEQLGHQLADQVLQAAKKRS